MGTSEINPLFYYKIKFNPNPDSDRVELIIDSGKDATWLLYRR